MVLVIGLFAMFSSIFTLQKVGLLYGEPFFLIGSRMLFAGILLLGYQFLFKRKNFKFSLKTFFILCYFGLVAFYISNIVEIWGLNNMASSKACLIYSVSPFLTALLAYFALGEVLSIKKWLGMIIGFLGLMPIIYSQTAIERSVGTFGFFTLAELAVLIAATSSVYGWILLKKVINEYKCLPIMANGVAMTLGGALALIHSYISGESWNPVPVNNYAQFAQNVLILCLISNIICYNLYGHLLKRYSATFMSFAGLVSPLFASIFGWLILGETVTWYFFISIALFTIGLVIFHQEESVFSVKLPIPSNESS